MKASIPPGLAAMLDIPGLGPKKIQALNQKLGVDSVELGAELGKLVRSGSGLVAPFHGVVPKVAELLRMRSPRLLELPVAGQGGLLVTRAPKE